MLKCCLALLSIGQDVIDLWPGKPPGETSEPRPDKSEAKRVTEVSRPSITVYRPAKPMDTGAAVVVCPGGGYRVLAIEHEGTDVAAWLTSIGVTAVLLRYRVPPRPGDTENKCPLQDVQRAVSIARSKAADWGVDAARLGVLGFSAGGHLAANASTHFDRRAYEPIDDYDRTSCRPDFAVLVYPGGVLDKQDKSKLSAQMRISKETPPSFLVVAADDRGSAPGTVRLYESLREAGVSVELHVYASGGHGFGMRKSDQPWGAWSRRCEEWMRARGLLAIKGKESR